MSQLLGNLSKGLVFVLSAPAGTGKTTLVQMLVKEWERVVQSVSFTTREPRPGETEGQDYHFVSKEEFERREAQGDFLERAKVFGHWYATSRSAVEAQQQRGKHVFLVIDTQGALNLRRQGMPAVYIFLSPPSMEALRERLCLRKTDSAEVIERRLAAAQQEMNMQSHYDYHIVNDKLEDAYGVLKSIVIAEEHRIIR